MQIVQHMQQIYNSSFNLFLKSNKLTADVFQLSLREPQYAFTIILMINSIYIFSDMRESYIKDDIIQAVNCIVLPLVNISVVLCKDKEIVFPQNRDIFAYSKWVYWHLPKKRERYIQMKILFKKKKRKKTSITVALHFLGVKIFR